MACAGLWTEAPGDPASRDQIKHLSMRVRFDLIYFRGFGLHLLRRTINIPWRGTLFIRDGHQLLSCGLWSYIHQNRPRHLRFLPRLQKVFWAVFFF